MNRLILVVCLIAFPALAQQAWWQAVQANRVAAAGGGGGSPPVYVGSSSLEQAGGSTSITLLAANNNVTGANPCMFVYLSAQSATAPLGSAISRNGKSFTLVTGGTVHNSVTTGYTMQLWYLVNPDAGQFDIVATIDAGNRTKITAVWFSGVNQSTPFGTAVSNSGGTGDMSSAAITSAATELPFCFAAADGASWVASQTERYQITTDNWYVLGQDTTGAASVTFTWTKVNGDRGFVNVGLSIKP